MGLSNRIKKIMYSIIIVGTLLTPRNISHELMDTKLFDKASTEESKGEEDYEGLLGKIKQIGDYIEDKSEWEFGPFNGKIDVLKVTREDAIIRNRVEVNPWLDIKIKSKVDTSLDYDSLNTIVKSADITLEKQVYGLDLSTGIKLQEEKKPVYWVGGSVKF
jgi:hypothetical protein